MTATPESRDAQTGWGSSKAELRGLADWLNVENEEVMGARGFTA